MSLLAAALSMDTLFLLLRWVHLIFVSVWAGGLLLGCVDEAQGTLASRAGAALTVVSGGSYLALRWLDTDGAAFATSWGLLILSGSAIGLVMALNEGVALLGSQKRGFRLGRLNAALSVPAFLFMGAASHFPINILPETRRLPWACLLVLVLAALEALALRGSKRFFVGMRGSVAFGGILAVAMMAALLALVALP